jgi:hypothetical protein
MSKPTFRTLNSGMRKTNTRVDKKSPCVLKKSLLECRNDETRRLNRDYETQNTKTEFDPRHNKA